MHHYALHVISTVLQILMSVTADLTDFGIQGGTSS